MATFSPGTIDWAIEHLARHFDTDIFPRAFEFDAIKHSMDQARTWLAKQDMCQWTVRPARKCLVPKQRYGFRIATQLDPLDMLFFLCLSLELAEPVESARVPASSMVSFSARYKRDDEQYQLFDHDVGFPQFQEYSRELCQRYPYVVITDIADFYPRIYLHRLENALRTAAPALPSHTSAMIRLIKAWNQNVSYGIPVGNNPSRHLAELVLDDVDRTLLSERITFCRYIDDFRIFCESREHAHRSLSLIASTLYDMHGLTLQAQKTKLLPAERFLAEVLESEERKTLDRLANQFRETLVAMAIDDPYDLVDFDELPSDLQKAITALNFTGLLEETLQTEDFDIPMARFLIARLAWLKTTDPLNLILDKMDDLYPVFAEVIRYLARLTDVLPEQDRFRIGAQLLKKLEGSVVSQLEYHRMLIMGLFAGSSNWGNADKLPGFYMLAPDNWLRRTILIALGKSGQDYWLRGKKPQFEQMPDWERRAFLYATSCLPKDERHHWYRAIMSRLDVLEKFVVEWAAANPANV